MTQFVIDRHELIFLFPVSEINRYGNHNNENWKSDQNKKS